jgi:hypothetical protein
MIGPSEGRLTGTSARGFFASLYDFSFHSFVTPKIVQIIYVLALVVLAIGCLMFAAMGFQPTYGGFGMFGTGPSITNILGHIVAAAIAFVVGSLVARVELELIIAIFRIAENTETLRLPRNQ